MAKKKTTKKKPTKTLKKPSFKLSNQQKLIFGSFLLIIGIYLFIAFLSFFFTGNADQSVLSEFPPRQTNTDNWVSTLGAILASFFIEKGFGVASFMFSGLIFLTGIYVLLNINKERLKRHWFWGILIVIWCSVLFGFFAGKKPILGGTIGYEMNAFLQAYIGKIGVGLLLLLCLIIYLAIRFKVTAQHFGELFKSAKKELKTNLMMKKLRFQLIII
jgi:hypothetical protein